MSKKVSITDLTAMHQRLLAEEQYSDIDDILTHINKHYSRNEKARALFRTIENDLFRKSISSKIKLKAHASKTQ